MKNFQYQALVDDHWLTLKNDDFVDWLPENLPGQGAFESMRFEQQIVEDWPQHFQRLQKGLRFYAIDTPFSEREGLDRLRQVLVRNNFSRGRIRLAIFKVTDIRFAIIAEPLTDVSCLSQPLAVMTASEPVSKREHAYLKTNDYGFYRQQFLKAQQLGFADALLLDKNDVLVEGCISNIFWFRDSELFTPAIACGCLAGITRSTVMSIAKRSSIKVHEGFYGLDDLYKANEVFLTNSVRGLQGVSRINDKEFSNPLPAPLTKHLMSGYLQR